MLAWFAVCVIVSLSVMLMPAVWVYGCCCCIPDRLCGVQHEEPPSDYVDLLEDGP